MGEEMTISVAIIKAYMDKFHVKKTVWENDICKGQRERNMLTNKLFLSSLFLFMMGAC